MKTKKSKAQLIEEKLNNLEHYPCCWVYHEGKRYIVQSRETGEVYTVMIK